MNLIQFLPMGAISCPPTMTNIVRCLLVTIFVMVLCHPVATVANMTTSRTGLLTKCIGENCTIDNRTAQETTPVVSTTSPLPTGVSSTLSTTRPLPTQASSTWCPESYRNAQVSGLVVNRCNPRSCIQPRSAAAPATSNGTSNGTGTDAVTCVSFSSNFTSCSKSYLLPAEFEIKANGSLWNLRDTGVLVPKGEYFLRTDRAIICASNGSDPRRAAQAPTRCTSYVVRGSGFTILQNGTLTVKGLEREVTPDYYELADNGSTVYFCQTTVPTCQFGAISPPFQLQGDFSLLTIPTNQVYEVGSYMLAEEDQMSFVCVTGILPTRSITTMYLFGTAALVSAICLLLALLAHLFFPSLNYHAKSLLCHAFSMFVMYLAIAGRYFGGPSDSSALNGFAFSMQYIFGLGTFFWLSVLGYDLWHVFSRLQGTTLPGGSTGKKRWFYVKCVYAWGIPVLLCITIIALTYSPKYHDVVGMNFKFDSWFLDASQYYFFYVPIAVILTVNMLFFILTIINIRNASSGADILRRSGKSTRKLFRVYAKIFVIMGLTWFAEIISTALYSRTSEEAWYVSDLINCLQGVLIFVIYVCKKNTLTTIRSRLGWNIPHNSRETSDTTSSKRAEHGNITMTTVADPSRAKQ